MRWRYNKLKNQEAFISILSAYTFIFFGGPDRKTDGQKKFKIDEGNMQQKNRPQS